MSCTNRALINRRRQQKMAVWSSFKSFFPLCLSTCHLAVQSVSPPGVQCLVDIKTWVLVTVMEGKGQIWHVGYGVETRRALWHFSTNFLCCIWIITERAKMISTKQLVWKKTKVETLHLLLSNNDITIWANAPKHQLKRLNNVYRKGTETQRLQCFVSSGLKKSFCIN